MLRLIEGGFFAGGHELIKKEISDLAGEKRSVILIVPEQQTLSCEREMADFLPPSAALCFEVTNFTRFCDTVFRALGGVCGKYADKTKKALIMWRALTELSPLLKTFGGKEISAGSVTKMLAATKQMSMLSLTPEQLRDAKDKLTSQGGADARLISKLSDISSVMALYKRLVNEQFSDSDDALSIAEEKLFNTGCAFLQNTEIYVDGFTSFTEPQMRMIDTLMRYTSLTLHLGLPKNQSDAFEYTEIKKTHVRLLRLAALAEVPVKHQRIDGREGTLPLISEISALLWRTAATVDSDLLPAGEVFRIFEAEDPHEECDFVAQDIKRRVMNGARFSEFGIIARSLTEYDGIIDVAFEKAGVPIFISSRADISGFEAIKLIFSALAAATGGFVRRDVISYSKCSLSGVDRALADEFELYVEKWRIDGHRFTDDVSWNMNPDGYTARRRGGSEEKLLRINYAKDLIISPLKDLADELSGAKTVKDYATALVEFLTAINLERSLKKKADDERNTEYDGKKYALGRLWQTICDSLDSLCEILGDTEVPAQTFINLLKITFAQVDIGRIPAYTEQVSAGDAGTARMYGKKHIYIIGANQGKFPLAVDDDSYFTDKDKATLGELGLGMEADTATRSAAELFYFNRAISYAKESVTLTYPALDTAFKPQPPSDAIGRIYEITNKKIAAVKLASLPTAKRVWTTEYALEHLSKKDSEYEQIKIALEEIGEGERLVISDSPIRNTDLKLSDKITSKIYGQAISMSQSKFEKYIGCPMSYFCSYNLGISAEERVEFDNRNIGIFVHSILENFFARLKTDGKNIAQITDEEKRALVRHVATQYVSAAFEGAGELPVRLKMTIDSLCRFSMPLIDSLCDEFADCEFEPVFFELKLDKNAPGAPEPSVFKTDDGREVYFAGVIDRVDAYKNGDDVYVRVIDYKTGTKDFKPEDIKEGRNLQMFLYLKSIVESKKDSFKKAIGADGGTMIPAGVIYVKANVTGTKISRDNEDDALREAKKSQEREGMLLNDPVSLNAMNGKFIPVKFKTNGDPDARSVAKLYTPASWDAINDTMESIIRDKCTKMVAGDICALPLRDKNGKSSVCQWCEYKPFCRNANAPKGD